MATLLSEYVGRTGVVVMPVRVRAEDVAEGLSDALGTGHVAPYAASEELAKLAGATVILVDDGFDSSERLREAAIIARGCGASRVVAAGPVGTVEACDRISTMVDRCVCLAMPTPFHSAAFWYDDSFRARANAIFSGTRSPRNGQRRAARYVMAGLAK